MTDRIGKRDVIKRLCALSAQIANRKFDWSEPADCFCGEGRSVVFDDYRYSDLVLKYIEDAVKKALDNEGVKNGD